MFIVCPQVFNIIQMKICTLEEWDFLLLEAVIEVFLADPWISQLEALDSELIGKKHYNSPQLDTMSLFHVEV
jgi:hypothetical protein